jgi:hypothetical protein
MEHMTEQILERLLAGQEQIMAKKKAEMGTYQEKTNASLKEIRAGQQLLKNKG